MTREEWDARLTAQFVARPFVGVWIVEAPPGCGKTTLIVRHAQRHPARRVLVLTFMVATREMLRARVRAAGCTTNVTCASIDALVCRVLAGIPAPDDDVAADARITVDEEIAQRAGEIEETACRMRLRRADDAEEFTLFEQRIVYMLMDTRRQRAWADALLGCHEVLFCDEAQDFSPYHAALMHVVEQRLRLGAVRGRAVVYAGDSDQHIFGFRNARNLLRSGGAAREPDLPCGAEARTHHLRLSVSHRLHHRAACLVHALCSKPVLGVSPVPFRAFRRDVCDLENAFLFLRNDALLAHALGYRRNVRILGWPSPGETWGVAQERFGDAVATVARRRRLLRHVDTVPDALVDSQAVREAVDAMNAAGDAAAVGVLRERIDARHTPTVANAVVFGTVWGYKGQEADVVRLHADVLALYREPRASDAARCLLVVAFTRARLAIVASGAGGDELELSYRMHGLPVRAVELIHAFRRR